MALAKATLETAFLATFMAMDSILDGTGDRYMADNTAQAIADYRLAGDTKTSDMGAAPAGAYTGSGQGKMTIDGSSLADDLYATFTAGYGNDDLAAHMAADIDKACSADKTVAETSQGTVTTLSGSATFAGSAEGKFSGNMGTIEAKLKKCFADMDGMTSGGNGHFASEWASAVDSYLKAGQISVELKSPFTKGTGMGTIA